MAFQIANKVMSDSPGLVDFPIRLVKSGLVKSGFPLEVGRGGGGGGGEEFNIKKVL